MERGLATEWADDCTLPPPGQDRIVKIRAGAAEGRAYKLTRLRDVDGHQRVEIALPIDYLPEGKLKGGKDFESEFSDFMVGAHARAIRARAVECLRQASPYLRSPEGDQLTLRLADPEEKRRLGPFPIRVKIRKKRFEPAQIKVRDAEKQEYHPWAYEYASDMSCQDIVHETMHLLGLIDEYRDTQDAAAEKCLPAEPPESLMRDHERAWARTFGGVRERVYEFRAIGSPQKFEKMKGRVGDAELDSMSIVFSDQLFGGREERVGQRFLTGKEKAPMSEQDLYFFRYATYVAHPGDGSSLLRRGQFRKILYPNCGTLNQLYDACLRYRMASDAELLKNGGCLPIPSACQDPNWVDQ